MKEKQNAPQIAAVVVVYNVHCSDSLTCKALLDIQDPQIRVIIYDNSTKEFDNQNYCAERKWTYLGGSGNVGLSKAYNAAIEYLSREGHTGLLCLFDDDTCIEKSYFETLRENYREDLSQVYVPLIYSAGRLLSPSKITPRGDSSTFSDPEELMAYQGEELTAINSAMAIDQRVFGDYRYDEKIFLDGVDHQFLRDCKKRGIPLCVIPYTCNHQFSGDEIPPYHSALNRFRIYIRDYRYICRDHLLSFILREGKRALVLTLRYKKLQFVVAFLKATLWPPKR